MTANLYTAVGYILLIGLAAMGLTEAFKNIIAMRYPINTGFFHRMKPVAPIFWGLVLGGIMLLTGVSPAGEKPGIWILIGLAGGLIAPFSYSFIKRTLRGK